MTYETPIEPTLGQVMKRINLVRKDLAKKLANTPQREWDAQPVREMCNHEKELHTALMVLRDLAGAQGAFAAGAPEVSAAVAGPDKEREAFEAWAAQHAASQSWTSIEREGDSYAGIIANTAWSAWKARGAAPALEAPVAPAVPDGATPGPWFVRRREVNGELRDCFVAAPDCQGLAYDACILCDDEYHDGVGRKLADCELIVAAVNQHRAALAAAPQAPRLGEDALHLLHRLLSNQHTLTGPEFRAELEKIVAEESARHAAAPQAPAAPSPYSADLLAALGQWHQRCEVMGAHHTLTEAQIAELVVAGLLRRAHGGQVITTAGRAALAAPAAPAVDADPLGLRDVGEALMETIERNADALKAVGWLGPMDCPSEIVVDLLNLLEEANTTSALGEWVATLEVDSEGGLDYETVPPCTLPAGCYPLYRAAQAKEGGAA